MLGFFRRRSQLAVVDRSEPPYAGRLALMIVAVAAANAALWCFGIRQQSILDAVEQGAAVIEEKTIGEVEEEEIRESIRTQRQSFSFWSTLAILGDLVVEPLSPAFRALAVTVAFTAIAALFGRPTSYGIAMADNVTWQAFWVAGAVLDAVMKITIDPQAVNSIVVFLPAKEYPANTAFLLASLHPMAICGWLAIGWSSWRRRQANWFLTILIIAFFAMTEASIRSSVIATLGALVRLTISQR